MEDFYTIQGEGFHAGETRLFHPSGRVRRGVPLVRRQVYVESATAIRPTDVRVVIDRALACPAPCDRHHGRRAAALPAGRADAEPCTSRGLQIFLETSGTHPFSGRFDWVCLVAQTAAAAAGRSAAERAHELKVIVESESDFEWAERNAARVRPECMLYLQPEWSVAERVMPAMVEYAKAHPKWNISIQTHKYMHIP